MASMAWCHTNILLSKMCEYFILDMTQMGEISKNHVECDWRFNKILPILCTISKCVIKAALLYLLNIPKGIFFANIGPSLTTWSYAVERL